MLRALLGSLLLVALTGAAAAQTGRVVTADSRTQITVYPRTAQPGPNAKRYCESSLVQEYRPSGTVIVPRMRCWWK